MDCSLIATELIAYHFGAVTDATREEIEAHLLGCTGCLRAYLALKGAAERGSHSARRPSLAAKMRLRDEVEATFSTPRRRRWFQREIPLYQGFAAVAVAAALALLLPRIAQVASSRRAPAGAVVDTSRTSPESLSIY